LAIDRVILEFESNFDFGLGAPAVSDALEEDPSTASYIWEFSSELLGDPGSPSAPEGSSRAGSLIVDSTSSNVDGPSRSSSDCPIKAISAKSGFNVISLLFYATLPAT
jgi:hypothetical protein